MLDLRPSRAAQYPVSVSLAKTGRASLMHLVLLAFVSKTKLSDSTLPGKGVMVRRAAKDEGKDVFILPSPEHGLVPTTSSAVPTLESRSLNPV